jgi:phosphohistidine phosphatase
MRLYVMRHGPAEDRAPSGRDFDRKLTEAGCEVVRRAALALRDRRGPEPLRLLASPYRRARETAELVATALIGSPDFELHEDLGCDAGLPLSLVRALAREGRDALLVGHQPTVEELVRSLVHPARVPLHAGFRTATIVTLEHETEDRFRFAELLDPHKS